MVFIHVILVNFTHFVYENCMSNECPSTAIFQHQKNPTVALAFWASISRYTICVYGFNILLILQYTPIYPSEITTQRIFIHNYSNVNNCKTLNIGSINIWQFSKADKLLLIFFFFFLGGGGGGLPFP